MSKTNVVEMKDPKAQERQEKLAAVLENFAQLAREGHISDLAIIGKVRGAPVTEFEWDGDNPVELIGALELAKMEIASDMIEDLNADDEDEDDD